MNSQNEQLKDKLETVYQQLQDVYGDPDQQRRRSPVSQLVSTILSQNTNNANRDRAFRRLRDRFPTWEAVRDAPVDGIIDAIRPAGLSNQKGPRIKKALQRITEERGQLSLDFLTDMPLEEARSWLLDLHGVGPKTAAIVLLFSLDLPVFPVDTHVHRVTQRLGLIGNKVSAEKAHDLLEELVPPDWYYSFHVNLIHHGREICHAREPRCEICVLKDGCDYYQSTMGT
jgi:endonuclease-3